MASRIKPVSIKTANTVRVNTSGATVRTLPVSRDIVKANTGYSPTIKTQTQSNHIQSSNESRTLSRQTPYQPKAYTPTTRTEQPRNSNHQSDMGLIKTSYAKPTTSQSTTNTRTGNKTTQTSRIKTATTQAGSYSKNLIINQRSIKTGVDTQSQGKIKTATTKGSTTGYKVARTVSLTGRTLGAVQKPVSPSSQEKPHGSLAIEGKNSISNGIEKAKNAVKDTKTAIKVVKVSTKPLRAVPKVGARIIRRVVVQVDKIKTRASSKILTAKPVYVVQLHNNVIRSVPVEKKVVKKTAESIRQKTAQQQKAQKAQKNEVKKNEVQKQNASKETYNSEAKKTTTQTSSASTYRTTESHSSRRTKINRQHDSDATRKELFEKNRFHAREQIQTRERFPSVNKNEAKAPEIKTKTGRQSNQKKKKRFKMPYAKERADGTYFEAGFVPSYNNALRATRATKKTVSVVTEVAKAVGKLIKKLVMVFVKLVGTKMALIIGGVMLAVLLIASVMSFFNVTVPMYYVMASDEYRESIRAECDAVESRVNHEISERKKGYDDVRYEGDGSTNVDYRYILCLLAVEHKQDFKPHQVSEVEGLHKRFYDIDYRSETYTVTVRERVRDTDGSHYWEYHEEERSRLVITINSKSVLEVADELGFNDEEFEWLLRLLTTEFEGEDFEGGSGGGGSATPISPEQLAKVMEIVNAIEDEDRKEMIITAMSLLGKTGYQWGGRAPKGGTPRGLDCSGFVDWVYDTSRGNNLDDGYTGHLYNISKPTNDIKPGDLGFWKKPNEVSNTQNNANHVGIYIGQDENGNALFIHCEGGRGVVISAFKFKHYREIPEVW